MRVSCARRPSWGTDAGNERPTRPAGRVAAVPGHDIESGPVSKSGAVHAGGPRLLAGLLGPLPHSSARHGRLRRNAVSPHGVKIGGASGAPLCIGRSSANRALTGKLLWSGIVAVPKVFDAGCPVVSSAEEHGQLGGSARSGDAGERYSRPGCSPTHLPSMRTHSDARRNTRRCGNCGHSAAIRAARINFGPTRGRCTGSTGLAGSPRRPRIMEGPISERHNRTPQRRAQRV